MRQPAYELLCALAVIAAITAWYVGFARAHGVPQPRSVVGYTLGVCGFLMMLSTETLYSLRKRREGFHLGPMRLWLQAHVFTGLVGPYLVLLHSGWKFHGLAGVLTLVTLIVVISGLIGRFIYTAVPRTPDGAELAAAELEARITKADERLQALGVAGLDRAAAAAANDVPRSGWRLVLGRHFVRRRLRRQLRDRVLELRPTGRQQAQQLFQLLDERQRLQMEMNSLEATRRLLAHWHMFHVPLSAVLFALAFVHVGAALYYSAFSY